MTKAATKPLHLTFRSVAQVVVEPDDHDRFVTTAAEAARACKQAQASKEFENEYTQFLSYVHEWCTRHTENVRAGYVDVGDGGLRVNICMFADDFDFDFDGEITELDIELAQKFPKCVAEVTQIPRQVCQHLELDSEFSILVYGDAGRTPEAGGA